jgi:hypothetical protein
MMNENNCNYEIAWVGKCKEPAVENGKCEKHKNEKCCCCGKPATHSCYETGQFVCGAPLCDECEHTTFSNGTNGGIGFNAEKPPEGMKEHCKKSEQRYFSWLITSFGKDNPEVQAILDKFNKKELSYLEADKQINDFF